MKLRAPSCTLLFALLALGTPAWAAQVKVCHVPPGNPANFHTITISENALQAHLAHGDLAGACFAHCDTLCSDGNACTIDACDASEQCLPSHPPVNCDDGNLCTTDSCNPATGCANVPKTCMDNNLCTLDACDPLTGNCVAPPIECPAGQSCDSANGECVGLDLCAGIVCPLPDQCHEPATCSGGVCGAYPNKPDGTICDSGIFGAINERCINGLCSYDAPY